MSPQFQKIKESLLGKRYDLSFVFVTPTQMRRAMRYKKAPTHATSNVLAFPLSKTSGEILICKSAAKPYTPDYLFIHACLHLKGRKHSATMEREEARILKEFGLQRLANATHRHRDRRRHLPR